MRSPTPPAAHRPDEVIRGSAAVDGSDHPETPDLRELLTHLESLNGGGMPGH